MMFKLMDGDVLEQLKTLPDKSVNTCVTSPPYYGLRDYGTGIWIGGDPTCPHTRDKVGSHCVTGHAHMGASGDAIYKTVCPRCGAVRVDSQIGLEETPKEYIDKLVEVFREVKRVLRDDGILWVNIGDSYSGTGDGRTGKNTLSSTNGGQMENANGNEKGFTKKATEKYKKKDLIGIPWMLAFALRDDGWYLRQDIIWAKNNPMPESVKDRCTRSHEYIFMLTKKRKYWFDHEAIQEDAVTKKPSKTPVISGYDNSKYEDETQESTIRKGLSKQRGSGIVKVRKNLPSQHQFVDYMKLHTTIDDIVDRTTLPRTKVEHWFRQGDIGFAYPSVNDWLLIRDLVNDNSNEYKSIDAMLMDISYETDDVNKNNRGKRNKRDVWRVGVCSTVKEAHFAVFPKELIEPCILAGCPEGGWVLDPFSGSGTSGIVALNNNRNYIGIELNPGYNDIARRRIEKECTSVSTVERER